MEIINLIPKLFYNHPYIVIIILALLATTVFLSLYFDKQEILIRKIVSINKFATKHLNCKVDYFTIQLLGNNRYLLSCKGEDEQNFHVKTSRTGKVIEFERVPV